MAQKSVAANVVTGAGSTNSVSASVTSVNGAVAYAWYVGTVGNEALQQITTINSVLITTTPGAGQLASALPASDNSTNSTVFDGLIYLTLGAGQEVGGGTPAGVSALNATGTPGTGTPLTSDGAGGIVEIDTDLRTFWDESRLGPTEMYVSAQEIQNITNKIAAGGGTPLFRFNTSGEAGRGLAQGQIAGGVVVGTYLNKFAGGGGQVMNVILHPNQVNGTIQYYSDQIPYQFSNVANPVDIKTQREYYQIDWPLQTRKQDYGVYVTEVLRMFTTFAFGVRRNIANG